jgi:hypothetical protein
MTLKAFQGDRFRFLPEIFTVNSRRFYHDLSTIKASITLHAPHRSVVVAFIRLVIQKSVSMSSSGSSCSGEGAAADRNTSPRCYTVISVETPDHFGFGSAAHRAMGRGICSSLRCRRQANGQ